MKIQVSDVQVGSGRRLSDDKGRYLKLILGDKTVRYQINTGMVNSGFGNLPASPFLQAVHAAFQYHLPLRIEPAYFWVSIIQELATMVKLNPTKFASLFNGDPANKKVIRVRCDELLLADEHWPTAIGLFRAALAVETGEKLVEGFFPHFSNDDATRELVYLVSVMDAASPYFKYEVHTLCGIPEIHLEGTIEDWRSLYRRVEWLEATFGKCEYFDRIKVLVERIGRQIYTGRPDVEFWKNIYKFEDSSGTAYLSGWVSDLYAHKVTKLGPVAKVKWGGNYSLNEFPSGLSVVDFDWVVYGARHPMRFFSGFTGMAFENGELFPRIGYGVIEGYAG